MNQRGRSRVNKYRIIFVWLEALPGCVDFCLATADLPRALSSSASHPTETGSQGSGVTTIELIAIASQQLRILTTAWRSVPQRFCSLYWSGGFGLCTSNMMKSLQDSWKNVASSGFGAIGLWNESRWRPPT